jgi:eukaryotic-like serine/threonine-protein kinase
MSVDTAQVVGSYQLERLLGRGAFCVVHEAKHIGSGERVALKQLKRVVPAALSAFKREFRTVQGLHHPNLVELRELFEFEGTCAIAMEFVPGRDLVQHVRGEAFELGYDPGRLGASFAQLAQALDALHSAGVVHRDVKPRNVLVTSTGRVVLLDFGLAERADNHSSALPGVGTAAYMAPEQATGGAVGPAADCFALGVCLYEALTGELPFGGGGVLDAASDREPVPVRPAARAPRVSVELDALCMRLLDPNPARRPGCAEVARMLGAGEAPALAARARIHEDFAGREPELSELRAGLARSRQGQFTLLLVEGESGIGKSALIAEFSRRASSWPGGALILRSRCYEGELTAYKAFDEAMEQLATELAAFSEEQRSALLPERPVLLERLFPAFLTVTHAARSPGRAVPADPVAQRLAGFQALAALLERLCVTRPVVFEIDDLQWADADSFRLLRALAVEQSAAPLLIVAAVRPRGELSELAAGAVATLQSWPCCQTLALTGLAAPDARRLLAGLLPDATEPLLSSVLRESRGHPLLLSEMARYLRSTHRQVNHDRSLRLGDALRARIDVLEPVAEALLSAVALAGRPYPRAILASALGQPLSEVNLRASELLAERLLRPRQSHELACYHDSIRIVAQARLEPARRSAIHASLADALAATGAASPADLALHRDAAGQVSQALPAYCAAATQALAALQFTRAEQLCARALELSEQAGVSGSRRSAIVRLRADALSRAGHSARAAELYFELAAGVEGEEHTQLRTLGVQQLLHGGDLERGVTAARRLLAEHGLPLPDSLAGALTRIVWDRTCTWLPSLGGGARGSEAAGPLDRSRLHALWALAMPFTWLDVTAGAVLTTHHLRLAHRVREPTHMARALAEDASGRAIRNAEDPKVRELLERARALYDPEREPALEVNVAYREGSSALMRWDVAGALERLEYAQRLGTERCPDQPWLLTNLRIALGPVFLYAGQHRRLQQASATWLAEASDRRDQFALTLMACLGAAYVTDLMADRPDEALAAVQAAVARWPREPFTFVHAGELFASCQIELARGGAGAYHWLDREAPRLARAIMMKNAFGKAQWLTWRASACLAARPGAAEARAGALLAEARDLTEKLRRLGVRLGALRAALLETEFAALAGNHARAIELAEVARTAGERCGDMMIASAARYLHGLMQGGEQGATERRTVLEQFASQGWQTPRRAIASVCPSIDELEAAG